MKPLPALLAFLIAAGSTVAESTDTAWYARSWQTDDGLPNSAVSGVAQTPEGYLWVATHSGVVRFDGERFVPWSLAPPHDRMNPLVRAMMLGRDDTLWFVIEARDGLLVGLSRSATNFILGPSYRPVSMTQTPDGVVWIGYAEGSVLGFRPGGATQRLGTRDGLTGTGECWVTTDAAGRLWYAKAGAIGTINGGRVEKRFTLENIRTRLTGARNGGLWILQGRQLLLCTNDAPPALIGRLPDITGLSPAVLCEDRSGALWVGTRGAGLFQWNGSDFQRAQTSHGEITSITEDREGNLWVGTEGGGLNRLRLRTLQLYGPREGVFESARSVCVDSSGSVWATGANGALVRSVGSQWVPVTNVPTLQGIRVSCVASDRLGGVWIGTYRAGLVYHREGTFTQTLAEDKSRGQVVRSLLVDSRNDLWVGTESPTRVDRIRNGSVLALEQPSGSRAVYAMAEDAAGAIWLGTMAGYLFQVQGEQLVDRTADALQPSKPIRALHAGADGTLWIGYSGGGIGRLSGGKFTRFGLEHGVPDNSISGIQQDLRGTLWFSHVQGIFQVHPREFADALGYPDAGLVVARFGRNEGLENLQGSSGFWPNAARGPDGRLWFATLSGLACVSPDRIQPTRIPPLVRLERFTVDGRELPVGSSPLRLPPDHRKIEVQSVALNFAAPENILFRYRLKGWVDNWSEPSRARDVTFSRLPAGRYQLEVAARNPAGLWSRNDANIAFEVEPFLWQRWWFRVGALGAFAGLIIGLGRYLLFRRLRESLRRLEQETSLQRDRARIAQDLHDELGSSLTEINFLAGLQESDDTDPAALRGRFDNIVERTRAMTRSLDEIVWAVNPANDTLKATANYLCSRAQEYVRSADVRCRLDVQQDFPSIALSAETRHNLLLAVIEAVTNVLKHAAASEIRLRVATEGNQLVVHVEDNGKGFDIALSTDERNGLKNMRNRCAYLGGECRIRSTPAAGTVVTFVIPLDRPQRH